jgi:hypothetical protein
MIRTQICSNKNSVTMQTDCDSWNHVNACIVMHSCCIYCYPDMGSRCALWTTIYVLMYICKNYRLRRGRDSLGWLKKRIEKKSRDCIYSCFACISTHAWHGIAAQEPLILMKFYNAKQKWGPEPRIEGFSNRNNRENRSPATTDAAKNPRAQTSASLTDLPPTKQNFLSSEGLEALS